MRINPECRATGEWINPNKDDPRYTAKISCDQCSLNNKELGFGQFKVPKRAEESLQRWLDTHCSIRVSTTVAPEVKTT